MSGEYGLAQLGELSDPQLWAGLLTLTAMEIVLGIDNLVFLTLMAERVAEGHRALARQLGLGFALVTRLSLLMSIALIMRLTQPVLTLAWVALSWRDLILIGGGLFLVYKGTGEIHARIEGEAAGAKAKVTQIRLIPAVVQIGLLDIVFSLDTVITAVGMSYHLPVMVAAIVIATGVMLLGSQAVAGFIGRHPTMKMLALSFLLLIGMTLIAEGFGAHVPKGYIYTAMGFSALVEMLNQLAGRKKRRQVAE